MSATYILLMGIQGSGKGTQADILAKDLHLPHVATGDLFRAMKAQDTPFARQIQQTLNLGQLVSDDITIQVVRERLKQSDAANGVIFDGFPRTIPQAEALDALLAELNSSVTAVMLLQLDEEKAIKRIENRRICTVDAGHIYNLVDNPPKVPGCCDIDGASLYQRPDDTREAVKKRFDAFVRDTLPLLDYYDERDLLTEVDADQPIETVTAALKSAIETALKKEHDE